MSTIAPRFIIVDNVDSSIQYTGPWFLDQGSEDSVGNFGPPYQNTLHGANANASLSFAFNGSQIRVIGTNNIRNDSGVLDPTWECFVDGVSIGATAPFQYPENNWLFCNQDSIVDGPHILTVNATILKNQTFWFDNIQYLPSASVSLNEAVIIVDHLDPQLQYGAGWEALGTTANMTLVSGSMLNFDFIGVTLSWYGFIPSELPLSPSSGTYSIDGGTPVNFSLKGIPANTATTYNQKFFETAQLSATSHRLQVVYYGNDSTPLTLTDLIIQNGTLLSTTTSVSTSVSSLATSATTSATTGNAVRGQSSTSVGPLVGGVVGGLALILFAVLGIFLLRRRQKRVAQEKDLISMPKPFEYNPSSVALNPSSGGISYSRVPQTASAEAKGQVYPGSLPSATSTTVSQSIEPPSTSSGVTTYPANLRGVPLHQTALTLANPSLSSPPGSSSPPASKVERVAATLTPRRRGHPSVPASVQSNDGWLSNAGVVLHADSGIRMPPSTSVVDVPPIYTAD